MLAVPPFTFRRSRNDTHIAWSLLEAHSVEPNRGYAEAALSNVDWALSLQRESGWFDKCYVTNLSFPLTHTLGYVFRGILEAYCFNKQDSLLKACKALGDGFIKALGSFPDDCFRIGKVLLSGHA